jgi:hypothetical protein
MKILIPIKSQGGIIQKLVDVYAQQTEKTEIVTIGTPLNRNASTRFCEAKSREMCNVFSRGIADEFVCMADSDCFPLIKTNLQESVEQLSSISDLGAVAFAKENLSMSDIGHVDIKSFVIRTKLLKDIYWLSPTKKTCLCYKVKESLADKGYSFRYLDMRKRLVVL